MRVNVYAEEMTDRIEIIGKEIDGHTFTGLRFYLELPVTAPAGVHGVGAETARQVQGPFMHRLGDDDSSAVTFWGKRDLRAMLRVALAQLDAYYGERGAPMSKCPMCGAPATLEIRLPDGSSVPASNLVEANGLLRTHQRAWPNDDLSISVCPVIEPSNVGDPK